MPATGKPADHAARMERTLLSLDGLSVGDAFGERFFLPDSIAASMVRQRALPGSPWNYTDDTEMALAIVQVLDEHGRIDQEALARLFGIRYRANPYRGYGGTAHDILQAIHEGEPWRKASSQAFGGSGSMGNGGAMRVAPLGAYFADDLDRVVTEARASAEVTHFHREGQAGAIAIAVAAAWAYRWRETHAPAGQLLEAVLEHTPPGATRRGLEKARIVAHAGRPGAGQREPGHLGRHSALRRVVRGPPPGQLRGGTLEHGVRARGPRHHLRHRGRHRRAERGAGVHSPGMARLARVPPATGLRCPEARRRCRHLPTSPPDGTPATLACQQPDKAPILARTPGPLPPIQKGPRCPEVHVFLVTEPRSRGGIQMPRGNRSLEDTPIEAPKTPTDALAGGRGGTPPKSGARTRAAQKAPTRASGAGAPKATKRVSGTKKVERKTAAKQKRGSAKEGALRIGRGTRAKQTTQRRSNKGGRASGP
jgi:hypothetical protein